MREHQKMLRTTRTIGKRVLGPRKSASPVIKVPLIDLAAQYRALQRELDTAVQKVLSSGSYILGRHVEAFEKAFAKWCGCQFTVSVNSGTDALELALRACQIGPGDDVIVPALTFMSTALAVTAVGATPIIVDIEEGSNGIDVEDAARRITSRTKAVIPVHLHGQACDLDRVLELAQRYQLKLIEDCAQAAGATYRGRPVGSFGNVGCFSFYPTKNLGAAGDGGAVVTNDPVIVERLLLLRNYGTKNKVAFLGFGRNSRLDELQAAILFVKLKYLDGWNRARRERARWYQEFFAEANAPDVQLPQEFPDRYHVYHLFIVRVPERDRVLWELRARGIHAMMHYPRPIHLDSPYEGHPTKAGDLPHAEQVAREILSLPMYPELSRDAVAFVVRHVQDIVKMVRTHPQKAVSSLL